MITLITERGPEKVAAEVEAGKDALWMAPVDVERLLGWTLKPEGLCRGPVCVPLSAPEAARCVRSDALDVAGLWRRMAKPVRHSTDATVWLLGETARERSAALDTLEAPNFTLPDLSGRPHSLVDYRGRKVFLATWASW